MSKKIELWPRVSGKLLDRLYVMWSVNGYLNKTKNPVTLDNPFKRTKGSHAQCAIQPKILEQILWRC